MAAPPLKQTFLDFEQPIRIAAQQRLEAFYASLGFRIAGAPYDEDGIAHVDMLLAAR